MANEWGRLIWWSGQNAAALQALTAIVVMFLTFVLIGITWYYANLTRQMALIMERQMVSAFQPNVEMTFAFRASGTSSSYGVRLEDSVHAHVNITNKSDAPLKLAKLVMRVVFEDSQSETGRQDISVEGIVIAPDGSKELRFTVSVPIDASKTKYDRQLILHCSDLAGFSKHTFKMSDNDADVTHYLGFIEPKER